MVDPVVQEGGDIHPQLVGITGKIPLGLVGHVGDKGVEAYRKNIERKEGAFSLYGGGEAKGGNSGEFYGLDEKFQGFFQFPGIGAVIAGSHGKPENGETFPEFGGSFVEAAEDFKTGAVPPGADDEVEGKRRPGGGLRSGFDDSFGCGFPEQIRGDAARVAGTAGGDEAQGGKFREVFRRVEGGLRGA
jgi:hypothetical protein